MFRFRYLRDAAAAVVGGDGAFFVSVAVVVDVAVAAVVRRGSAVVDGSGEYMIGFDSSGFSLIDAVAAVGLLFLM